jgi:Domain of unknown function (DUF4169)
VIQRRGIDVTLHEVSGLIATNVVTPNSTMGELVNLRIARKRAKRHRAEADAAVKRLVHGRSKSERAVERSRDEKARKELDQKRIETGEGR